MACVQKISFDDNGNEGPQIQFNDKNMIRIRDWKAISEK